jgi:hypothetical protein
VVSTFIMHEGKRCNGNVRVVVMAQFRADMGTLPPLPHFATLCPHLTSISTVLQKRLPMLMTSPGHGYAMACSSFLRRSIALLNASIIALYIISSSRKVPVKIAPSLIGKSTDRSSRANCFWVSNPSANSATMSSNPFLSMSPSLFRAMLVYHPRSRLVDIGLVLVFFAVDRRGPEVTPTSSP